jgi:hypothetical protein
MIDSAAKSGKTAWRTAKGSKIYKNHVSKFNYCKILKGMKYEPAFNC